MRCMRSTVCLASRTVQPPSHLQTSTDFSTYFVIDVNIQTRIVIHDLEGCVIHDLEGCVIHDLEGCVRTCEEENISAGE